MDCLHIPHIDMQQFNDRVLDRRIPLLGGIELTHRCNVRCVHCYCRLPADDKAAKSREMSLAQIRRILDEIAAEGCLYLVITGGEPLLRPDFLDIYDHAKRCGLLISLFTNATMITPQIADHLREWPPLQVEISLYGMTRETYEKVTGVPGSYDRCLTGIGLLRERGIRVALKTVAMTVNHHEVAAMKQFAKDLGVAFRFDTLINPKLDGSKSPYDVRLDVERTMALEVVDEDRMRSWSAYFEKYANLRRLDTVYACGAGRFSFFIDPSGRLVLCTKARQLSYDLLSGAFHQGWADFFPAIINRKRAYPDPKCETCNLTGLCSQCPGRSQLEFGPDGEEVKIDYICQLAHMRYAAYKHWTGQANRVSTLAS